MKISIIGLGLMGGSFSLALKHRFKEIEITGWDISQKNLNKAKKIGLIDTKCNSIDDVLNKGDWIILAIPVQFIQSLLPSLLDKIDKNKVIVDFGSVKASIGEAVKNHPKRKQYIAAHPIAGTEHSGPDAAITTLFESKTMIVCDQQLSDIKNIKKFEKICKFIGMNVIYLPVDEHDMNLAYMSHLSHVISFALSHTVLEKEKSATQILNLAGSGFDSTVRLAKSSPEMWTPIVLKNKKYLLESLKKYVSNLTDFIKILEKEDEQAIESYLYKGREIKKILK